MAKFLGSVRELLNEIAYFPSIPVEVTRSDSIAARRNDGLRTRAGNGFHEDFTVVRLRLIGHHAVGWDGFDQHRTQR